ncbi:unnamed protein product [Caretta caretta]
MDAMCLPPTDPALKKVPVSSQGLVTLTASCNTLLGAGLAGEKESCRPRRFYLSEINNKKYPVSEFW